jgi:hypothetical protein
MLRSGRAGSHAGDTWSAGGSIEDERLADKVWWPVLCLENLRSLQGPQMSELLGRVLAPAFLILGMVATAAWTLLLGYGLFALVEAL